MQEYGTSKVPTWLRKSKNITCTAEKVEGPKMWVGWIVIHSPFRFSFVLANILGGGGVIMPPPHLAHPFRRPWHSVLTEISRNSAKPHDISKKIIKTDQGKCFWSMRKWHYTQSPLIRLTAKCPALEVLKNSSNLEAHRFLILQAWALAVS